MGIQVLLISLCILLLILLLVQRGKYEKLYDSILFQLDQLMANETAEISSYLNTRHSAIASRLEELKRKINQEIDEERISREKVHMFISDLSHQVKTPLTNVIMYHGILAKKSELNVELKEMQDKLTIQLDKLEWILGSLFKSVYLEEEYLNFDMDYQNITQTISKAVSSVFKKAEDKAIEICVDDYKDIPVLHNVKWTAEAFENLLENSIKYSPAKSKIWIRIIHGEFFTEIAISDEGIGIEKEELQDIFRRFYRSKKVSHMEGSGIGLFMVKIIVEKEKGYVTVNATKEKGSTFSVFLQNFKN